MHLIYRFSQDIATKLEYLSFRFLISAYLVYVAVSVTCTCLAYHVISMPHWLGYVFWYANHISMVIIALSLYMFTSFRYATHLAVQKWFVFVSSVPVTIILICLIVSTQNGMIPRVTPDNLAVYGPMYYLLPLLTMMYFAAIMGFALIKLETNRSYIAEKQLGTLIMSCVLVFTVVMLDTFFRKIYMSILPGGILIAIVFLYINMQDSGIYTDTLTGMNNRRKANEYLGQYLSEAVDTSPLYLYMCDVNFFKKINDEYGHDEGDKALVLVAEAIKGTMAWYEGFAARLGGDEFLLTWAPKGGENAQSSPESFIDDLQSALMLECARAQKPYTVSVSLGYTLCNSSSKTLADYMREADEMLYQRKRQFHDSDKRVTA